MRVCPMHGALPAVPPRSALCMGPRPTRILFQLYTTKYQSPHSFMPCRVQRARHVSTRPRPGCVDSNSMALQCANLSDKATPRALRKPICVSMLRCCWPVQAELDACACLTSSVCRAPSAGGPLWPHQLRVRYVPPPGSWTIAATCAAIILGGSWTVCMHALPGESAPNYTLTAPAPGAGGCVPVAPQGACTWQAATPADISISGHP